MKVRNIHKIFLVYLLAVLVMTPPASQAVHVYLNEFHDECHHAGDCHEPGHDCRTCPVCHFTYSAFTEADIPAYETVLQCITIPEPVRTQEAGFAPVLRSSYLRGPPQA